LPEDSGAFWSFGLQSLKGAKIPACSIGELCPCVLSSSSFSQLFSKVKLAILYPPLVFAIPKKVVANRRQHIARGTTRLGKRDDSTEVLASEYFVKHLSDVMQIVVANLHEDAATWSQKVSGKQKAVTKVGEI